MTPTSSNTASISLLSNLSLDVIRYLVDFSMRLIASTPQTLNIVTALVDQAVVKLNL